MTSFLNVTYKDHANQKSGTHFQCRDISEANLDDIADEFSALRAALEPYTLGNLNGYEIVQNRVVVSQGKASNPLARRELKSVWKYEDSVTHKMYDHELLAPELNNTALWQTNDETGTTSAITSGAEWTALKAAFEAVVVSPAGNEVILHGAYIKGRNL